MAPINTVIPVRPLKRRIFLMFTSVNHCLGIQLIFVGMSGNLRCVIQIIMFLNYSLQLNYINNTYNNLPGNFILNIMENIFNCMYCHKVRVVII